MSGLACSDTLLEADSALAVRRICRRVCDPGAAVFTKLQGLASGTRIRSFRHYEHGVGRYAP